MNMNGAVKQLDMRVSIYVPFLVFVLLLIGLSTHAQQDYWQQKVCYHIDVELDDKANQLHGQWKMTYFNESPHLLDTIWMHLWPNGYLNNNTAFAQQKVTFQQVDFYFADEDTRGYIDSLAFSVGGQPIPWALTPQNPDIAFLVLPSPLSSGDSLVLHSPFRVKIPKLISRLGYEGQAYQISQWYPKPAVFDKNGWHTMPYLENGEYYGEFGHYEVAITLPENYVVAATGTHVGDEERIKLLALADSSKNRTDFLEHRIVDMENPIPESSTRQKTVRFEAANVHDFAWFADKRFLVQQDTFMTQAGKEVDIWVMYLPTEEDIWAPAKNYVKQALLYFDTLVGAYPYPQMTVVQGALGAGGGMEYPMITVIGPTYSQKVLNLTIAHEVGHNWFYGILGFNERQHPWLDEGLTSYYEKRYEALVYAEPVFDFIPNELKQGQDLSESILAYWYLHQGSRDIAPSASIHSPDEFNYWWGAYLKPAAGIKHIENWIGQPVFDQMMQSFYAKWSFRHPSPEDVAHHFEQHTGQSFDWFFRDWIGTAQSLDYGIKQVNQEETGTSVLLENKQDIAPPILVEGQRPGGDLDQVWVNGFSGAYQVLFPHQDYERISINPNYGLPEWNRKNNHWYNRSLLPYRGEFQTQLIPKVYHDQRTTLTTTPAVSWNQYDGFMAGLAFHNLQFPAQEFQFALLPMYGFKSKSIVGIGGLQYRWYPKESWVDELTTAISYRQFAFDQQARFDYHLNYQKITPKLQIVKRGSKKEEWQAQWRSIWLEQQRPTFSNDGQYLGKTSPSNWVHELSIRLLNKRAINPYDYQLTLEQQQYRIFNQSSDYIRAALDLNWALTFNEDKNFNVRIFAGAMLRNTQKNAGAIFPGAFSLFGNSTADYRYDHYFLSRNTLERDLFAQQISLAEGGIKAPIPNSFNIGRSNSMVVALNLSIDLPEKIPLPIPVKPYFDIGYFDNAMPTGSDDTFDDKVLWSGGLELSIWKGRMAIYLPLIHDKQIKQILRTDGQGYFSTISYYIDLHKMNPLGELKLPGL